MSRVARLLRRRGTDRSRVPGDRAWDQLLLIIDLVKYADLKLYAILSASAVLSGVTYSHTRAASNLSGTSRGLFIAAVTFFMLSSLITAWAISPRTRVQNVDAVYFGSIATRWKCAADYAEHMNRAPSDGGQWLNDVSRQIWINSTIARRKHTLAKWSTRSVLCGLALTLAAFWSDLVPR